MSSWTWFKLRIICRSSWWSGGILEDGHPHELEEFLDKLKSQLKHEEHDDHGDDEHSDEEGDAHGSHEEGDGHGSHEEHGEHDEEHGHKVIII